MDLITDDNCYIPIPTLEELNYAPRPEEAYNNLERLLGQEDTYLACPDSYVALEDWIAPVLRVNACEAKRKLVRIVAELEAIPPEAAAQGARDEDLLEAYLQAQAPSIYRPTDVREVNNARTFVENRNEYNQILKTLGCSEYGLQALIDWLSHAELEVDVGDLVVPEGAFGELTDKPAALPSVRLMGEGETATYLPTDTAPSRIFNYGMVQRLVEPELRCNNEPESRRKVDAPLDVWRFKEDFRKAPERALLASSLGLGYVLNMHQAWVPAGFALGSLLYSLVLAPGEEQRIIIKEHREDYSVSDTAAAEDSIRDIYSNSQQDNESAAFSNAADRYSGAHSDYEYYSKATSKGSSGLGLFFGLVAGSKSTSTNSGHGSSNASQTDTYSEVSQAAQSFQTDIKTESERIATARRASIRVASSSDSESVASKIIANHNHSHVMTVQYWEVMRRYRMETCIEGVDLVLFVPLQPIAFLPQSEDTLPELSEPTARDLLSEAGDPARTAKDKISNGASAQNQTDSGAKQSGGASPTCTPSDWMDYVLMPKTVNTMNASTFAYRYRRLLTHADTLLPALPPAYRGGLELMKKFAAYPAWKYLSSEAAGQRVLRLTLTGPILDCDDLRASLCFTTGRSPLPGSVSSRSTIRIHESMNTREDVLYFLEKARSGKLVMKLPDRLKTEKSYGWFFKTVNSNATLDKYYEFDLTNLPKDNDFLRKLPFLKNGFVTFSFTLPAGIAKEEIASIRLENRLGDFRYRLSQNSLYLEDYELASIKNYEEAMYDYAKNNKGSEEDAEDAAHYRENLPACYTDPEVVITRDELLALRAPDLKVSLKLQNSSGVFEALPCENPDLGEGSCTLPLTFSEYVMRAEDVERMEKTLQHVVNNTVHYSQVIWSSLSDDERIMLLEQFNVSMNFSLDDNFARAEQCGQSDDEQIPLLNCVNPKRVLGFYGNCMLLPFTYPERLAKVLGKTAAEIQDELYRYHTTNFRVPSTLVSVATEGMVGEAVLGATNVSEKVDVTRFWNWKDSDIDHMNIDQSSFRANSSLLENAQTMRVDAPTQGVTPTAHVDASSLAAALLARQSPTFADALANTDIRDLLKTSDANAAAGREAVVAANSGMINTAVQAAADVAKAYVGAGGLGGLDSSVSSLLSGLSSGDLSKLLDKLPVDDLKKLAGLAGKSGSDGGDSKPEGGGDSEPEGGGDSEPDGSGGDPSSNPNPPAADPEVPSPESDASSNLPGYSSYTPANDREANLHALFEQARQAIGEGSDPVRFFTDMIGAVDQDRARETIQAIAAPLYSQNGIDREALGKSVLQM